MGGPLFIRAEHRTRICTTHATRPETQPCDDALPVRRCVASPVQDSIGSRRNPRSGPSTRSRRSCDLVSMGSTGDSHGLVGDPADRNGRAPTCQKSFNSSRSVAAIPSGEPPDDTGGPPVLPHHPFGLRDLASEARSPREIVVADGGGGWQDCYRTGRANDCDLPRCRRGGTGIRAV